MKKTTLFFAALLFFSAEAQTITWQQHEIDGHRTGVTQKAAGMTVESMGKTKRFPKKYYSPNGRRFRRGTAYKVANIMIAAQDSMAKVKQVVGHSPRIMKKESPECALSDWYIDALMAEVSALTGKKVDVGFANFGGIRIDMPEGDVFRDDIMSMFPFRNTLYYFTLSGADLLEICENLAKHRVEVIGGLKLVIKGNTLESATIKGEPIDPNKIYAAATLDYLMEGKSWFRFGRYKIDGINTKANVMDIMLKHVDEITKQGKEIEYEKDGRVTIL